MDDVEDGVDLSWEGDWESRNVSKLIEIRYWILNVFVVLVRSLFCKILIGLN